MSARPSYCSRIPRDTDTSVADLGAQLLGLDLKPQGYRVAGLMEARARTGLRMYPELAVQMPRRSAKTTSIWAVLLGRCATIPGYRVVTTAQDGARAGEKMRDHMELLQARDFEDAGYGRLYWSNGKERIKFANGSVIWTVVPKPGAFRSAAADAILFDEAGELDPQQSEALLAGALPLMDTRPDPQVIITGTPSEGRDGLLWHALENGRHRRRGSGALDYSIRDDESLALFDPDDPDARPRLNEPLMRRTHPGVGTLTTIAVMRQRFDKMQLPQFEREYGGRFGFDSTMYAIDPLLWASSAVGMVDRPARVGIAFDVAYDGSSSSLAYAWRDAAGVAYVELVEHRAGTSWLPREAHKALTKYRGVPVAYDQIGANLDPGTALSRIRPAPRIDRITMKDVMGATQRIVANLHDGKLHHFGQSDLDAAIENLTYRTIAHSGRAFGVKVPHGPAINPLVACAHALWSYDRGRDHKPLTIAI